MRSLSKRDKEEFEREIGIFVQQYRRKSQKGREPNDRSYDRGVEQVIRKLNPEVLDELLNGTGEET
jgi:hypothetical protein